MTIATILILVDELKVSGLSLQTFELSKALSGLVRPVVVAQSYISRWHPARWLPFDRHLYQVTGAEWDAQMGALAADLVVRFAPRWALAVGWENATLVEELYKLDVPSVFLLDRSAPDAAAQKSVAWAARNTEEVFVGSGCEIDAGSSQMAFPQSRRVPIHVDTLVMDRRWVRSPFGKPSASAIGVAKRLADAGESLALRQADMVSQHDRDAATIIASQRFNAELFQGPSGRENSSAALDQYLRTSQAARNRPVNEWSFRRPTEGFNPLVYALQHIDYDQRSDEDPFAHYLRSGAPNGPWMHKIIGPAEAEQSGPVPDLRIALHAHMYYPELTPDLIACLRCNRARPDLFVTTSSDAARDDIVAALEQTGFHAKSLQVVPNRGRDVWPFLELLGSEAFADYDVVGHLHGKRSVGYEGGDNWRNFLWRHVIGGPEPMLDAIAQAFARDPMLGLVFPEDPHLCGWNENLDIATKLARRAGLPLPLPPAFEFPVGSMFWARPVALAPLLDFGLTVSAMPEEPVPIDGTVLHAVERLVPFCSEKAGFAIAATHVPGCARI